MHSDIAIIRIGAIRASVVILAMLELELSMVY